MLFVIISTEDNPAYVPFDDCYLHLIGKFAKVGGTDDIIKNVYSARPEGRLRQ